MPPQSDQPSRPRGRGRAAKRSFNACDRCRKQKIKCSGGQPCEVCDRRQIPCSFDEREPRVLVSRKYIRDLKQRVANQERQETTRRSGTRGRPDAALNHTDSISSTPDATTEHVASITPRSLDAESAGTALTNPMSTRQSAFATAADGRIFYLGTSSNWSFARRVLSMTYEKSYQSPLPTSTALLFDGYTYDLGWTGPRSETSPETLSMPTLDYAIYLINSVKFHCGQMFHLFDENIFMGNVHDFYSHQTSHVSTTSLWYIHFLVVLAFGKAFVARKPSQTRPIGTEFFVRALQLLPDASVLALDPVQSTEIFCCLALYYQALDFRQAAHNFIGQAIRMALYLGMHTDMPEQYLGEPWVERCRRTWWTVYVLERTMTSLLGLPHSIHDEDIQAPLPAYSSSPERTVTLGMQVKLSRIIARVNRKVYGPNGRLNDKFLASTKEVLAEISVVADEIPKLYLVDSENRVNGISRISAYLNLQYHQCIVLATRPLLFCFLRIRLESQRDCVEALNSAHAVRNLMRTCIDSSQQMVSILEALQTQDLLETFIPFDLESIFVSTINLIIGPVLHPMFGEKRSQWLRKAYNIFDEMISDGNLIARLRKSELLQLDEMLDNFSSSMPSPMQNSMHHYSNTAADLAMPEPSSPNPMRGATAQAPDHETITSTIFNGLDPRSYDSGFTTANLMDLANAIDINDTEWISHAITEYCI